MRTDPRGLKKTARALPNTLKPSHELHGEVLPRAGRAASAEAYAAFLRARARADAHLPKLKVDFSRFDNRFLCDLPASFRDFRA